MTKAQSRIHDPALSLRLQSAHRRFTDDIVIRIACDEVGARIDMRSTSRQGRSDFGVNATHCDSGLTQAAPGPRPNTDNELEPPKGGDGWLGGGDQFFKLQR